MSKTVHLKNGTKIQLANSSFAKGGEGELFEIISPNTYCDKVAKIFSPNKRDKERETKLEYLLKNAPPSTGNTNHNSIIWVTDLIFDNGSFVGFLMPVAKGEKLEMLCHTKHPRQLGPEWKKFDFASSGAMELRLKICFNIAVALYQIHNLKCYVLVDMKPENIMIQSNGLISIIDTDSVAVIKNNNVLFHAPVATPEYSPPEHYTTIPNKIHKESWDRFSLAVIFYRVLCGIHPFTGTCNHPYDKCVGLADMVEKGLFPHGNKKGVFKVIPPPHKNFSNLKKAIQDLFINCFEKGHFNPEIRPTAADWCASISNQTIIDVGRPLPSRVAALNTYTFNKSIAYNFNTSVGKPVFEYMSPKSSFSIKDRLFNLFSKSKKQLLVEAILLEEETLKNKCVKLDDLEKELKDLVNSYQTNQSYILENEKIRLEHVKDHLVKKFLIMDDKARQLFRDEAGESFQLNKQYDAKIEQVEANMKNIYYELFTSRRQNHERCLEKIRKDINDIQELENNEMITAMSHPTKLAKYRFDRYASEIFKYSSYNQDTVRDLSRQGFQSLADIESVSPDGQLRHRTRGWVKVPGIGPVRARAINDYFKKVEITENQIISKPIKEKFISMRNVLNAMAISEQKKFDMESKNNQIIFKNRTQSLEPLLNKLKLEKNEKSIELKKKYDDFHVSLTNEAKFLNRSEVEPKLKELYNQFESELKNNLQSYVTKYSSKKNEIDRYLQEIFHDYNTLKILHYDFVATT